MKIKNKIKRVLNTLLIGLIVFQTKSNAIRLEPAYGIRQPKPEPEPVQNMLINNIGDFFRIFLIPIIILSVGIIIYLIKGKSSFLRKIINVLIIIGFLLGLFFLIRFIILQAQ